MNRKFPFESNQTIFSQDGLGLSFSVTTDNYPLPASFPRRQDLERMIPKWAMHPGVFGPHFSRDLLSQTLPEIDELLLVARTICQRSAPYHDGLATCLQDVDHTTTKRETFMITPFHGDELLKISSQVRKDLMPGYRRSPFVVACLKLREKCVLFSLPQNLLFSLTPDCCGFFSHDRCRRTNKCFPRLPATSNRSYLAHWW